MSKHTPGDWLAVRERHFWVVLDDQGQRLACLLESESVFTNGVEHDDALANANLMASAPAMLEALEEIEAVIIDYDNGAGAYMIEIARAAIAKAKGGEQ